jgi:transposase
VRLQLRVRRFFCRNRHCDRTIFTERLPTVVAPWARRSLRLAEHQRRLGLDFGGKAASRAATRLGLPASADTVLREVRRAPRVTPATPRVLGVDDWAWRKGQTYGTILIDLETHRPVDLLPDRSADALAQWLSHHPGVEIISRDRSGAYGDGAARGAPQALQVADRFHLLSNLREALEGVLTRHQAEVRAALSPPACPDGTSVKETADPGQQASEADSVAQEAKITTTQGLALPSTRRRVRDEQQMATNRARRLARYDQVIALHRQGVSQKAMAARLDLCPKTIRRWLRAGGFPERAPRRKRVTRLEPYASYLHQRWESGCHNGAQLWREVCQQGYLGSRTLVAEWAARQRRGACAHRDKSPGYCCVHQRRWIRKSTPSSTVCSSPARPSLRPIAWPSSSARW